MGRVARLSLRFAVWLVPAALSLALGGCGGATPLMHPAGVLPPGQWTMGAGTSAQLALQEPAGAAGSTKHNLEQAAMAPGMAPWVGARVGLRGDNEGGLAYAGRTLRLDARHAFSRGSLALSAGLGGSVVLPERRFGDEQTRGVYGGGLDLPVLGGWSSQGGLYALWVGPRVGLEFLRGRVTGTATAADEVPTFDVDGKHVTVGGLAGLRAGFRHVFVVLEVNGSYHTVSGSIGDEKASVTGFTVAPGGALVLAF